MNRDHNFSPRSPKIGVDFQPASKEPIVVNELRIYSGSNAAFTDMTSVATVSVIDQEYITRPPKELPLELFDVLDFIVFEVCESLTFNPLTVIFILSIHSVFENRNGRSFSHRISG